MVSIVEIFELISYINGGTRPFEEGSRIVNFHNILLCGHCEIKQNSQTDKYFETVAATILFLRSTNITSTVDNKL
ncbi:hypothetical protein TSAR_011389 [Trichomalopsis sarcophagae]|uniref:Uncharacterized protein n=1 Tax=Trichomalopsis sarcophagae TaxID=543379 RepID=A0A232EK81_9HYME|nr:hypothetical protein TSAR_011389 [Trichomalopsis sarcophagae]